MSKDVDELGNMARALATLAQHRRGLTKDPNWTFAKTGKALKRSPSLVSTDFGVLEARYGYQLVERTPKRRSNGLTSSGEIIGRYAHVMIALDEILRNADMFVHDGDELDHLDAWLKDGCEKLQPFMDALDQASARYDRPEDD